MVRVRFTVKSAVRQKPNKLSQWVRRKNLDQFLLKELRQKQDEKKFKLRGASHFGEYIR
jgi:cell division FtsZ-interacting protein ZapD